MTPFFWHVVDATEKHIDDVPVWLFAAGRLADEELIKTLLGRHPSQHDGMRSAGESGASKWKLLLCRLPGRLWSSWQMKAWC